MGQGKDIFWKQREWLNGRVSRFEIKAKNDGVRRYDAQREVLSVFASICQGDSEAFVFVTNAKLRIQKLIGLQVTLNRSKYFPIRPHIYVGLHVDFFLGWKVNCRYCCGQLNV